ncbi:conserved exported protein of unknown function [Pseudodesulfovibrio profundus]|uniref:Uncharacterized protein n=1 Tax=Pseudodesulfovibrio profundus TaxID=57320 RepID=A0A2C8F9B3_9BACT|nr:transporter substrate-binding domain-containing protein [Pseudodesulfovibrio profundus]SOB59033.1 conserved exported protein of unknown function [Pseudodesulfovibrio profundus]
MFRSVVVVLFVVLVLPVSGNAGALQVNTSIKPPFSTVDETGCIDQLLKELGKRLDQQINLVRLPPERALIVINEGKSDMELPRIAGLEKKYPNLVMVPEKVLDYHFVAFSRTKTKYDSWDDLKGMRVGYIIGWKIFEKNVPPEADVTKLRQPLQLMEMLEQGRIDVALYERAAGQHIIHEKGFTTIETFCTPLADRPMYLYMHNKHADIVPVVASHLRAMKEDGTYSKIFTSQQH